MQKIASILLLSLILSCSTAQQRTDQHRLEPLTILHWNDFHARNEPYKVTVRDTLRKRDTTYLVGGTATLLGYINKWRTSDRNVLTLNAGDDFQGTPISSITFGRSQIELMNIIAPDAMELGNHEFDYGTSRLRSALAIAQFPILCANVWDAERKESFGRQSFTIQKGNVKVGLIGCILSELPSMVVRDNLVGLTMLPTDSILTVTIEALKKEKVNLIVLVSHMGFEQDSMAATRHPEIDVIVGGHNHAAFFNPKKVSRTLIVQAESWGRWLGKLDLVVDLAGDSVYSASGRLIETRVSDVMPDPRAAAKVEELLASQRKVMNEVIGELKTPWVRTKSGRREESNVGDWQADAILQYAKADVAFQNNGGIRMDLPAGPIKLEDIWMMNPFGNSFVTFKVSGKALRSMVEFQTSVNPREFVHVAGIRYVRDSSKPPGQRLVSVEVQGQPLDDSRVYLAATNNYVASNMNTHFGVPNGSFESVTLPSLDRDVFIDKVREEKTITSTLDGRIKDVSAKNK